LRGYDYRSAGAYFITLCTVERATLFGDVRDRDMHLNSYGHIVLDAWMETAIIRPGVILDEFMVMPNHFHAIVFLPDRPGTEDVAVNVGAHSGAPAGHGGNETTSRVRHPRSLGSLVAGFKVATTKQINVLRGTPGLPVWQRNYYEHIIRDDKGLRRIREYITNNPATWESDTENPSRAGHA
jgi:REP element-mobilizing transposase RayT